MSRRIILVAAISILAVLAIIIHSTLFPPMSTTPTSGGTAQPTPQQELSGLNINGAGASFQYPQIAHWARLFQEVTGVTVTYQSVGSGAGQRMFLVDRVVDFAASDPPLSRSQWEQYRGQVIQVPWMMGAVAVVYNVPGLPSGLNLSGDIIAKIYRGDIEYWNDPAIVALNPALADKLPRERIIAVHRSDSSGTTEVFTLFIHKAAPDLWPNNLVGKQIEWPVDRTGRGIGAKGNEGVTATVLQTPYSMGYVELSYAIEHKISIAAVRNVAGKFLLPSEEAIRRAASTVNFPESPLDDFSHTLVEVVYSMDEGAYPIATLAYAFFWRSYNNTLIGRAISEFLGWVATEGYKAMVPGYVVPPDEVRTLLIKASQLIGGS